MFINPVAAISCLRPCSPKHFLNPPTVWGLRWCNFFHWHTITIRPVCFLVGPWLKNCQRSCVSSFLNAFLRCPPWCWMVCPPSRRSCLPLYPFFFAFVGWCVRLPEGLVSHCTPSFLPLLDGVSAFPRVLSPIVPLPFCLCWMVCPPSRGSCLPLSPIIPLLDSFCWMACPPSRGSWPLSLIAPLLCLCWMACPPSRGSCLPLYRFFFAFVGWCICLPECLVSPWRPLYPFLLPFVGWCVCLPEGLVSHCSPFSLPLLDVVSAFPRVLSPIVPLLLCLCWMLCPPSRGSCLPLYPFFFAFVGWCVRLPEGLVSPCLPLYRFLLPLLDGVFAFPRVLAPVSHCPPLCSFLLPFVGWCGRLPEGLVSCFPLLDGVFCRVLSPFVSDCTPSCSTNIVLFEVLFLFPFVGWCMGLVSLCLSLSPIVPLLVALCWMVCLPSRGSCLPLSPIVPLLASLCWMVRPPSRCIISPSLPLSPHMCACFGWCVRLPEGLGSCLPLYPFLLPFVGWCGRFPEGLVSCVPLLDGVSACRRVLSPFVSNGFLFPFVGWCVCLPEGLVSPCFPLSPFLFPFVKLLDGMSAFPGSCFPLSPLVLVLVSFCWMVCLPSRGSCLPLSPIIPLLDSLCWMVCPPSWEFCLPLHPFFFFASVGWCVRLPEGLGPCLPLSPIVSHCTPSGFPVLDGVSVFPRSCLPLSPFLLPFVGWCVRFPDVLSPLLSHCLPTCVPVLDGVSAFPRSCLPLSPRMCPCWVVCPPSRALLSLLSHCLPASHCLTMLHGASAFEVLSPPCLPLSPFLFACVGWCTRLPEALPPFSPSLSPSLSLFLFPFVAGGLILPFSPNSVLLGVLNAFSCVWPCYSKHFLNLPTVWGLRWCIFFTRKPSP